MRRRRDVSWYGARDEEGMIENIVEGRPGRRNRSENLLNQILGVCRGRRVRWKVVIVIPNTSVGENVVNKIKRAKKASTNL